MTPLIKPSPCPSIAAAMRPTMLSLSIPSFLCQTKARSCPLKSQMLSDASLLIIWSTNSRVLVDGLRQTFNLFCASQSPCRQYDMGVFRYIGGMSYQ